MLSCSPQSARGGDRTHRGLLPSDFKSEAFASFATRALNGIIACLQTHSSLADWHRHLHLVVTDGGFRPDGTFVRWPGWPGHDTAHLTEAFRRAVLRLFVRRGLFEEDQAAGMLQWPHSGFHVHAGVGVPEDERAFGPPTGALLRPDPGAIATGS